MQVKTYALPKIHFFFVLATQNPIEQEGTYPLPEAQLDRFMYNITLDYPSYEDELDIVKSSGQELEGVEAVNDLRRNSLFSEISQ